MVSISFKFGRCLAALLSSALFFMGCVSTQSNFAKVTHIPNLEEKGDMDIQLGLNTNSLVSTNVAAAITNDLYLGGSASFGHLERTKWFTSSFQKDKETDFRAYLGFRKIKDVNFGLRFDFGVRKNEIYRENSNYDLKQIRVYNIFGLTPSYTFKDRLSDYTIGMTFKLEKLNADEISSTDEDYMAIAYPEFTTDEQVDIFFNYRLRMKNGWAINTGLAYLFAGGDATYWDLIGGSSLFNNTQRFRFNMGVSKRFSLTGK